MTFVIVSRVSFWFAEHVTVHLVVAPWQYVYIHSCAILQSFRKLVKRKQPTKPGTDTTRDTIEDDEDFVKFLQQLKEPVQVSLIACNAILNVLCMKKLPSADLQLEKLIDSNLGDSPDCSASIPLVQYILERRARRALKNKKKVCINILYKVLSCSGFRKDIPRVSVCVQTRKRCSHFNVYDSNFVR